MIHGQCSKGFPKDLNNETNLNINGYPLYWSRDSGINFVQEDSFINNGWIVPCNQHLTLKYHAHINVEICSSVRSVKYLYIHAYKGHYCASLNLRNNAADKLEVHVDEIDVYLDCRFVSYPEAV